MSLTLAKTANNIAQQPLYEKTNGLSQLAYFSQEVFDLEQEMLWSKTWQWVARESDLPNPGDYITYTIGNQPLFIIRTEDNALRAMYNVCPHRGAQLLEEQGHCNKRIQCAYHAWNFDFDGNLKGLPQAKCFPEDIKSSITLTPILLDTWGGFIFVNIDPQAKSLSHYLAGFDKYLEMYEYAWNELKEIDQWSYNEPVNWKFSVENYCECYHLPVIHSQSLKCFDPNAIKYTKTGRHYQIEVPWTESKSVENHPSFAGRPKRYSLQGLIFPNMMFNTAKDMVSIFHLKPLTPETTQFKVFIYQTPDQMQEFPYKQEEFREEFNKVLMEDFEAVRMLQKTVRSNVRPISLAHGLESGITHFHHNLAGYLSYS